jgi:hypothetical protein
MAGFVRRRLSNRIVWCASVVFLGLLLFLWLSLSGGVRTPKIRFTKEQAAQINEQARTINEKDVISLIGMPPGNYSSDPTFSAAIANASGGECYTRHWASDEGCLSMMFDRREDQLVCAAFLERPKRSDSKWRAWLRWIRGKIGI